MSRARLCGAGWVSQKDVPWHVSAHLVAVDEEPVWRYPGEQDLRRRRAAVARQAKPL